MGTRTEADSFDITECSHDDKHSTVTDEWALACTMSDHSYCKSAPDCESDHVIMSSFTSAADAASNSSTGMTFEVKIEADSNDITEHPHDNPYLIFFLSNLLSLTYPVLS